MSVNWRLVAGYLIMWIAATCQIWENYMLPYQSVINQRNVNIMRKFKLIIQI